jgi:hypothetical protein
MAKPTSSHQAGEERSGTPAFRTTSPEVQARKGLESVDSRYRREPSETPMVNFDFDYSIRTVKPRGDARVTCVTAPSQHLIC